MGRIVLIALAGGFSLLLASEALAATPVPVSPVGPTNWGCPTFSWSALAGSPGYELVIYTVSEAAEVEETPLLAVRLPAGTHSWTPSAEKCLASGRKYAWAIRALDGRGPQAWSEPALIEVVGPSMDEVQVAIATLRRYLTKRGEESGPLEKAEKSEEWATARDRERRGRPPEAIDSRAVRPLGQPPRFTREIAAATGGAPSLGEVSLTVSDQIHLHGGSDFFKRGELFLWDDTTGNLALGEKALMSATGTAMWNTAVGRGALQNTSPGPSFLGGALNTAIGYQALSLNTWGYSNTAIGAFAVESNTTGTANTGIGISALRSNTTGFSNTASGSGALRSNTTGYANTASGSAALSFNTTGSFNTATGSRALRYNRSGSKNTSNGRFALFHNSTGSYNTASGVYALSSNSYGHRNSAFGHRAGENNTTGNDSIFIANQGTATDDATIKIGTQGTQASVFIAGIFGATVSGSAVEVNSSGQLGVAPSSVRFKVGIKDLGEVGERLLALRPVSFRYKPDVVAGGGEPKVGLLAEEVAEIFPELVTREADGQPFGVRYDLLSVLLLAEIQRQEEKLKQQEAELVTLRKDQAAEFAAFGRRLATLEAGEPPGRRRTPWWLRPFRGHRGSP